MAELRKDDLFIVGHGGRTKETLKVSYESVKNSIAPLAIPAVRNPDGSETPGVAGKVFPGPGIVYNQATGEIQAAAADSLRLIGLIESDDAVPRDNAVEGDFYISTGTYNIKAVDWPGLTDARLLEGIDVINEGTGYRPQSGDWHNFGKADDPYTKINPLRVYGGEGGLELKLTIQNGLITDIEVQNQGSNYRVDQVLELEALANNSPYLAGHIKVKSVDTYGEVLTFVMCYADGSEEVGGNNIQQVGSGYILPPDASGQLYGMYTTTTNGVGSGLRVNFATNSGRIVPDSIVESISSNPRDYKQGEHVYVYNSDGNPADGMLEITISTSAETVEVNPNDKVILSADFDNGAGSTYKLVPDFIAGQALFDVAANPSANVYEAYTRSRVSGGGYNTLEIDIRDATETYSGLLSPEGFTSLDGLVPGAQPGTIVEIISNTANDLYNNNQYDVFLITDIPLNITNPDDNSKNVSIDMPPAVVGKRGSLFLVNQQTLDEMIIERFTTGGSSSIMFQESTTSNIEQQANTFMPQNFTALPKHPRSTN